MHRLVLACLLIIAPAASAGAQTLSTRDIIELTRAGLGEEVLLALIEVHRPVFPIDPVTLKMLKDAGVRQGVIVAMVKSGREVPPVEPGPEPLMAESPPPPQVVVVDHRYQEEHVREVAVPVAVPVYIPVRVRRSSHLEPQHISPHVQPQHVQPVRRSEPVYWGFGGKLRPDAWKPSDLPHRPWKPSDPPQKK